MKWIGQHIWDFISRFRSDVYLEGTETGTIASGGNLGLDSNNKIVKAASGSGDLTITDAANNRIVTSSGGTDLLAETYATFVNSGNISAFQLISNENSAADYLTVSVTTNGETTFQTIDNDASLAHMNFVADGSIDIDAADDITIDAVDDITITAADQVAIATSSADGHITLSSAHTAGLAVWIDGNANVGSIVDIDAGILDIDVAGVSTIDTTSLTITGKTLMNNRTLTVTAGSAAGEYDGDVVYTGTTTGMTAGDLYFYNSSGTWSLTNAASEGTTKGLLAIALGAESDVNGMLLRGMVTSGAVAGTPDEGATLYMRDSTGDITTAAPSGSGRCVRIVGYCMENSNNRIYFNPDNTYIELA